MESVQRKIVITYVSDFSLREGCFGQTPSQHARNGVKWEFTGRNLDRYSTKKIHKNINLRKFKENIEIVGKKNLKLKSVNMESL